jgi:alpha-1,6-mannosyltransferase
MTHTDAHAMSASSVGSEPIGAGAPVYAATAAAGRERGRGLSDSAARRLGLGLLALMVIGTALIVLDGAAGKSALIPPSPHIASYLDGIGAKLNYHVFLVDFMVLIACYAGLLALARRVPIRWTLGGVVLLHLVVLAGPVLLSQDIFSYVAYGRMGTLHGLNPYVHGPSAAIHDPIYHYIGHPWKHVPTAYGPVFTLASYPIALIGLTGALWGMKVLAVAASLGTVWMVWRCAELLGRDPRVPALLLGLNPLVVIYDVGGAHNDLIMGFLMMVGIWLALREHDGWGSAMIVFGAAVKATSVAVLPFMALGRRRVSVLTGTVAGIATIALIAFVGFGAHALDFVSVLRRQQSFVSTDSFPNEVAHLFGLPGVFPFDRALLRGALGLVVVYLLVRVWRGYDWLSASTVTMLAVAVTTTWLLAWYTVWALPLAVLSRDRRVLWATLGVQGLFFVHQLSPMFT